MHLLATEEYGLRCLLQVARCSSESGDRQLTIQEIAAAEGMTSVYAGKIMRALREGGLVSSTRGASGGYRLARSADSITPWDVIQVLGGSMFPESFCETHPGARTDCVHSPDCSIRALWRRAESAVEQVLASVTLADLRSSESTMVTLLDPRLPAQGEVATGLER